MTGDDNDGRPPGPAEDWDGMVRPRRRRRSSPRLSRMWSIRPRRPTEPPGPLWGVPLTAVVAICGTAVATVVMVAAFGWQLGAGLGLLLAACVWGPRMWQMDRFVAAAYDLMEGDPPICNFEKAEARRRNWWRARLKSFGIEIDYTYSDLARAPTRKGKWITLEVVAGRRWSLWMRFTDLKAMVVRIPPRTQVATILPRMIDAAAEFFGVDPIQIETTILRRLRRMRVRFTPTVATTAPTQRRGYGEVNNRPVDGLTDSDRASEGEGRLRAS